MAHAALTDRLKLPSTVAEAAEAYAASCKALDAFSIKRTPLTLSANGQTLVLTGFEKALVVEVVRVQNERLRDELVAALQKDMPKP